MDNALRERRGDRRADPILATLVDVAIAYRDNVGSGVAQAFLRETGVPETLAQRVLNGSASMRSTIPRRRIAHALHEWAAGPA